MNPLPLSDDDRRTLLDYHRRQLNRAMVQQANLLAGSTFADDELAALTARIAAHVIIVDMLEPVLVMATPSPLDGEALRDALAGISSASATLVPGRLSQQLDDVLAWLDEAPEDWPFTGADIAQFIRNGCPPWTETDSLRRLHEAAQGDVADWIEEQDWETVPASFVADCVREQFGLPNPNAPRPMGPSEWRAMGFEPGDVVNDRGGLLLRDGTICEGGALNVTLRQSVLASPFGWVRTGGDLNSGPLGVVMVERR